MIQKKCEVCGKMFSGYSYQKYCSKACRKTQFRRTHVYNPRMRKECSKKCAWCNKVFTTKVRNTKYCSNKCRESAQPITSYKLRFAVLYRDEFRCQYCGATPQDGVKLHVDHIVPKSKGGINDITNLITTCQACNLGKHDLLLDEYPTTAFSEKAVEILSREVLDRKALKDLGIYSEYQRFLKLIDNNSAQLIQRN